MAASHLVAYPNRNHRCSGYCSQLFGRILVGPIVPNRIVLCRILVGRIMLGRIVLDPIILGRIVLGRILCGSAAYGSSARGSAVRGFGACFRAGLSRFVLRVRCLYLNRAFSFVRLFDCSII